MAEMQLSLPHVRLCLQQPDTWIELGDHIDLLVPGRVENIGIDRAAVMASDKCDITVAPVTQFHTAITDSSAPGCQGNALTGEVT
ncbi:hypothetical protein BDM02DRAFT_3109064 [Thelephora ganbajun]|uniref:Uncharacterized protein n=1 Tax=Thelephora ganbajun TaxID=370292 RepID=A0ACB6ZSU5_THEGA|nr:hypothetical protein BDM02DRAFT_3109064 [Thelephora ganbajun]